MLKSTSLVNLVAAGTMLASGLSAQAKSGPFGLCKGLSREAILKLIGNDAVIKTAGDALVVRRVPKPHPAFDMYTLVVSPNQGLVKLLAVGITIKTNGFGDEVRESFMEIRDVLAKTYGN